MNLRTVAVATVCFCSCMVCSANAQPVPKAGLKQQTDFIVVVVNSEPITNNELRAEVRRVEKLLMQQGKPVVDVAALRREVLERMINERAQLQVARETGVRVDQASVDLAEQTVAQQNKIDVDELHARLLKEGVRVATFRAQLLDQLLLTRLHERDVQAAIRITESDIDRYLSEQQKANTDPFAQEINLAQILIAVPEHATAAQVAALFKQAQEVQARLRAGEDFASLVPVVSAAAHLRGGEMGLRRADRYPPSFVLATKDLDIGAVSDIVRSGAGFHLLKVIVKRAPLQVTRTVVQSHVRHILLRTGAQLSPKAAQAQLETYRKRIQAKELSFANVAREISQDGSAQQGGDLGWVMPGVFVPEFEEVMNSLAEGELSKPVVSRFGVHLIELLERRRVELDAQQVREMARDELRAMRYKQAYAAWEQDVRARTFVDFRDPPQ